MAEAGVCQQRLGSEGHWASDPVDGVIWIMGDIKSTVRSKSDALGKIAIKSASYDTDGSCGVNSDKIAIWISVYDVKVRSKYSAKTESQIDRL